MKAITIFDDRRSEWDAFLEKEPFFALMQSWVWGQFKEKSGWNVFRIAVEEKGQMIAGAQMLIKPLMKNMLAVAYVPRGPFGNWLNEEVAYHLITELQRIARTQKAVFLKIEPPLPFDPKIVQLFNKYHFRSSPLANQPTATVMVNLDMEMDNVSQQLRKRTREYIRYSERKGVKIRVGGLKDLPEFNRLMQLTARREDFTPHTLSYYQDEWNILTDLKQTVLLMAYFEDHLLGVHMACRFGKHAAYFHGGSSRAFTELRPNYLLVWEAIKWAKMQGCISYDLWGIPNEVGLAVVEGKEPPVTDRSDDLWGVYHFKRGFSKNIIAFSGSWDYVYDPVLYPLFVNKYFNIEVVGGLLGFFDSLFDVNRFLRLKQNAAIGGWKKRKEYYPMEKLTGTKPYAVVFALDSINGLQTARTLARHGVPVIGIAKDPRHHYCKTRVCEKIIYANTESEDVVKTLAKLGSELSQKAVIFPCNDLNVQPVSLFRQQLEKWYYIILPDPAVYTVMMQKTSFYPFAQKEGFPIPRTFIIRSREEAVRASVELVFPCILKPSSRSDEWDQKSKSKAYKAFTAAELLSAYEQHQNLCQEFIVQEWIEGPDSSLYTCYCYFSRNSEPLVTFVTRKIRQWPPEIGEGCLGEECQDDVVLNEAVRLFKCAHLRGLGYLEMKRDSRSGKYFIIEPNIGRPTSKSSIAEAGGVELVYTMYCDALGWDLPPNREQKYGNAKWVFFRRDLQSAFYYWRRGDLTLIEWFRSLRGIKVDALFSWSDPAPFWLDLLRSFGKLISGANQANK